MQVTNASEIVAQLAGTIVAGEVDTDGNGLHLYFEDGRVVILTGVIIAFVGRVSGRALN